MNFRSVLDLTPHFSWPKIATESPESVLVADTSLVVIAFSQTSIFTPKHSTTRSAKMMMNQLLQIFSDEGMSHWALMLAIATLASWFVVAADAAAANPRSVANMPIMR